MVVLDMAGSSPFASSRARLDAGGNDMFPTNSDILLTEKTACFPDASDRTDPAGRFLRSRAFSARADQSHRDQNGQKWALPKARGHIIV
jgi:hypothetical protein